ncbi:hypothetical protein VTI28DRAFT_1211 [Corynascus sepedonium]
MPNPPHCTNPCLLITDYLSFKPRDHATTKDQHLSDHGFNRFQSFRRSGSSTHLNNTSSTVYPRPDSIACRFAERCMCQLTKTQNWATKQFGIAAEVVAFCSYSADCSPAELPFLKLESSLASEGADGGISTRHRYYAPTGSRQTLTQTLGKDLSMIHRRHSGWNRMASSWRSINRNQSMAVEGSE